MGLGRTVLVGLGLYALVTAVPSAQMEAKEPGSSFEYRDANATAVNGAIDSTTAAVQYGIDSVSPLMRSLLAEAQGGLATFAPAPGTATTTTLPTPVLAQP